MKKHISFFSGMRGFDLAAEKAGWENIASVEIDESLNRRFKKVYPNAYQHTDIRDTDFTTYRGLVDVVSAGWPCQPNSNAGKRLGREDVRFLWPESIRGIREIQPQWVVGENVRGIVSIEGGLVFEQVCADLEAAGYEVQPYILPAAGVNAPHERYRVWFVAHATSRVQQWYGNRIGGDCGREGLQQKNWEADSEQPATVGEVGTTPHATGFGGGKIHQNVQSVFANGFIANSVSDERNASYSGSAGYQVATRREQREISGSARTFQGGEFSRVFTTGAEWENFPTQSPICDRNDGLPVGMDVPRLRANLGRLYPAATEKNIERAIQKTITAYRNEMIKAAGNAVVWQIPYRIFQCINEFDKIVHL